MLQFEAAKAAEGERFLLWAGDGPKLEVTLASVESRARRNLPDHLPTSFSLLFKGTPQVLCPQGTYTLEGAGLGPIEMFIVPIAQDEATGEFVYQALFN